MSSSPLDAVKAMENELEIEYSVSSDSQEDILEKAILSDDDPVIQQQSTKPQAQSTGLDSINTDASLHDLDANSASILNQIIESGHDQLYLIEHNGQTYIAGPDEGITLTTLGGNEFKFDSSMVIPVAENGFIEPYSVVMLASLVLPKTKQPTIFFNSERDTSQSTPFQQVNHESPPVIKKEGFLESLVSSRKNEPAETLNASREKEKKSIKSNFNKRVNPNTNEINPERAIDDIRVQPLLGDLDQVSLNIDSPAMIEDEKQSKINSVNDINAVFNKTVETINNGNVTIDDLVNIEKEINTIKIDKNEIKKLSKQEKNIEKGIISDIHKNLDLFEKNIPENVEERETLSNENSSDVYNDVNDESQDKQPALVADKASKIDEIDSPKNQQDMKVQLQEMVDKIVQAIKNLLRKIGVELDKSPSLSPSL